ncbi:MAG: transporter [Bdellovibrionota bacterium]
MHNNTHHRFLRAALLAACVLCASSSSFALDVQIFQPVLNQKGSASVSDSYALPSRGWQAGIMLNFVRNPLEFAAGNNNRTDDIVDAFVTADVMFAYGITDRIAVELTLPFNAFSQVEEFQSTVQERDLGFGDPMLAAKILLLPHREEGRSIAVSVRPYATIPTKPADQDYFANSGFTAGATINADARITRRNLISMNLGGKYRQDEETLGDLTVGHEFTAALAYVRRISDRLDLDAFVELYGSTVWKHFGQRENSSPIDMNIGFKKGFLDEHLALTVGGGRGVNVGYGAPDYRFFAGLSYLHGKEKEEPQFDPVMLPGELNIHIKDQQGNRLEGDLVIVSMDDGSSYFQNTLSDISLTPPNGNYRVEVTKPEYAAFSQSPIVIENNQVIVMDIIMEKEFIQEEKIEITGTIFFDLNKETFKEESRPILDHVADVMLRHRGHKIACRGSYGQPGKRCIQPESISTKSANCNEILDLKERRRKSIVLHRLWESKPVQTNDTPEGVQPIDV